MPNITQHVFTVEGVMPAATFADLQAVLANQPTAGEMAKRIELESCRGAMTHLAAQIGMPTAHIFDLLTSGGQSGGTNYAALAEAIINFKRG